MTSTLTQTRTNSWRLDEALRRAPHHTTRETNQQADTGQRCKNGNRTGSVRGKNIWGGGWPLIIWEATTAKRNYYETNYIKHVEKLDLNYPEKI